MSNAKADKAVGLREVINTRLFALGVADFTAGRPLRDSYADLMPYWTRKFRGTNAAWAYERGRLFAAYCAGKGVPVPALKTRSGRVSGGAITTLHFAVIEGAIT